MLKHQYRSPVAPLHSAVITSVCVKLISPRICLSEAYVVLIYLLLIYFTIVSPLALSCPVSTATYRFAIFLLCYSLSSVLYTLIVRLAFDESVPRNVKAILPSAVLKKCHGSAPSVYLLRENWEKNLPPRDMPVSDMNEALQDCSSVGASPLPDCH